MLNGHSWADTSGPHSLAPAFSLAQLCLVHTAPRTGCVAWEPPWHSHLGHWPAAQAIMFPITMPWAPWKQARIEWLCNTSWFLGRRWAGLCVLPTKARAPDHHGTHGQR